MFVSLNYVVNYIGAIWAVSVIYVLVLGLWKILTRNEHSNVLNSRLQVSAPVEELIACVVKYVDLSLPSPFVTTNFSWSYLIQEIKSYHQLLRLVKWYHSLPCTSRVRTVIEVVTIQTVLCYCLIFGLKYFVSVFYH